MEHVEIKGKRYITTREARAILGNCARDTFYNLIRHYKAFETIRVGASRLVELESFLAYCRSQGIEVEADKEVK